MSDVLMGAVTAAFFALCLAYVRWCDHIIGPDPTESDVDPVDAADRSDADRTEVPA